MDTLKSSSPPANFDLRDKLLKRTTSRCPICHAACPAEVWRTGGIPSKVQLKRTCAEHGEASVCIASDARFYWLAQGKAENACCGGQACRASDLAPAGTLGRNADPGEALGRQEKLSTCLALIEIVNSCNLACPTCYADSPAGAAHQVDAVPLEDLQRRIQGVVDRKGGLEILQLSGGEPTLHPHFFELLRWLQDHPKIDYVLLNTNGVRIAQDEAFARALGVAFRYGGFQLYLQFDGAQEQGQRSLRGADLRAMREHCLQRCREMNIPVTLAMTVTRDNLPFVWAAVEFGLQYPNVRGICFQPIFGSGRIPSGNTDRLNTADIILAAVGQSAGRLRFEDFTPLPCGDPNCAAIGYLLKVNGQVRSVSVFPQRPVLFCLFLYAFCASDRTGGSGGSAVYDFERFDCAFSWMHRYNSSSNVRMNMLPHQSTAYGWLTLAGIFVSIFFWSRIAQRDSRLVLIYVAGLAGAFFGAKIVYLAAEGWLHWHDPNRWVVLATGKSITGALLGGYAGVEAAKRLMHYTAATGDWFAVIAPLGIMLGRVGCILQGCCLGMVCEPSWFTMNDASGAARWPAALVELLFNALMLGVVLLLRWRKVLPGQHFHIYLMAYGLFRFAHEFLRDTPRILGPISGYQIAALAVAMLGAIGFFRRQRQSLRGIGLIATAGSHP